tara:strand:+ start:100 stop:252 length:153 start_codon:yes stop_codon:yes gene_type:complete
MPIGVRIIAIKNSLEIINIIKHKEYLPNSDRPVNLTKYKAGSKFAMLEMI